MVEARHLSCSFGSQWALKDISFSLGKGEFLFLTGHSGAGKTTLLRLLYGALPVTRGALRVAGFDLHKLSPSRVPDLRRRIGVVFQDFKILPKRTVYENVALALEVRGMARHLMDRRVRAIIRALGLEPKAYSACERLSGGEQQRVAIARSMVTNPSLILADEPTGNLDEKTGQAVGDLLVSLNRDLGMTFVVVTHNVDLASVMGRRLELRSGELYAH